MDIFECLAAHGEMGVSEIAQELGMHVATVHNILKTFRTRHYVLGDNGRYSIGPAIARLALKWESVTVIPRLAQPSLKEITRKTRESAVASVIIGDTITMVASTIGTEEVTIRAPKEHHKIINFATGRVLAACGDTSRWEEHIRGRIGGDYVHPSEPQTVEAWTGYLEQIRQKGEVRDVVNLNGTYSVAGAVYDASGQVVTSIGVSCPGIRSTPEHAEEMMEAVREACRKVSEQLGYTQNSE